MRQLNIVSIIIKVSVDQIGTAIHSNSPDARRRGRRGGGGGDKRGHAKYDTSPLLFHAFQPEKEIIS
jgi:hypothetical protein